MYSCNAQLVEFSAPSSIACDGTASCDGAASGDGAASCDRIASCDGTARCDGELFFLQRHAERASRRFFTLALSRDTVAAILGSKGAAAAAADQRAAAAGQQTRGSRESNGHLARGQPHTGNGHSPHSVLPRQTSS